MTDIRCPDCDGPMTKRTNRETEEQFWGCLDYPNCRGTRPLDDFGTRDLEGWLPSEKVKRSRRYE